MLLHADDGDFFDNLQPSSALPTPEKPRSEQAEPPSPALRGHLEESVGESEATIERALYIGNYSAAVDACIKVRFRTEGNSACQLHTCGHSLKACVQSTDRCIDVCA